MKKIGILAECAYQFDGKTDLMGGGERWLVDFVKLLHKLNYKTKVYQFSYEKFDRTYHGIKLHGLGNITTNNPNQYYKDGLDKFYKKAEDCDGIFLLSMNLSMKTAKKPTITVSHGLMFDGVMPKQKQKAIPMLDSFKKWVRNATHTISVDTNSIKVMQTYWYSNVFKMTYVPNYVDLDIFKPIKKENGNNFNIIFPRRKQYCRGYHTMMSAANFLLDKYDDITITFCGRGNKLEEDYFNKWYNNLKNSYKKRIKNIVYDMKDMWKAYQNMDIACIPTIYAEGTSLSVLESQACGVVPIVTHVGGLTDLVLNNYNGLLIKPDDSWSEIESNSDYLFKAIEYLYHNRDELKRMRENAISVVQNFSKEQWEQNIKKVVKKVYGDPNE